MPTYHSNQRVKSGLPLGGIGAGKLEITPYGTLDYLTFLNNWRYPLTHPGNKDAAKACGVRGFHFALYAATETAVICKLLQTEKVGDYPVVSRVGFEAEFPFARLSYEDENMPVEVSLIAYSSFVPGSVEHSSLPVAVFEFALRNRMDKEITVGLLGMGRNVVSRQSVGRYNEVIKHAGLTGIAFSHQKPLAHDEAAGDCFLGLPADRGKITYLGQWNMQGENFVFEKRVKLDAFDYFSRDGNLPNTNPRQAAQSQSLEWGGAVASTFRMVPGQTATVPFYFAWHFPRHFAGHMYERAFRKSWDVAAYVCRKQSELRTASERLPQYVSQMGLESWLKDALLNNLYPLVASTWLTRKGDFAMFEAPQVCPLMNTLDVYFYAATGVGLLFPELERKLLGLFRRNVRTSGYVPHDLGLERLDLPSNGTTMPLWKDLNSKFILLVYKAYRETQDLKFLKDFYPALKKAFYYSLTYDRDGDGLPECDGFDTTFDTWDMRGANAYVGGIFLASCLALKQTAELLGDRRMAKRCVQRFVKGRDSYVAALWNGRFFMTGRTPEQAYSSCMVAQLAGQWYAYVLGLGRMFDEEMVKSAVRSVLKLNAQASSFGAPNSVLSNGKKDTSSYHAENIWPTVCYSFAALAIYEGLAKEGLKMARTVWKTICERNKNPWNQPDVILVKDGSYGFGDYYMRNIGIWAIVLALAEKDKAVAQGLAQIRQLVREGVA